MLNSVQIQGRLTKTPEYNQQNQVVHFTVACQRSFKNKQTGEYDADFIRCVAFGQRANFIAQHFNKGSRLIVVGRWQTGSYTDQQGNRVFTNDLVVSDTEFDDARGDSSNQPANNQPNSQPSNNAEPDIQDSDLPF